MAGQGKRGRDPDPNSSTSLMISAKVDESCYTVAELDKRKAFVREYVKDFQVIAAYMRAFPDISYAMARKNSGQILREPYVRDVIHNYVRLGRPEDIVSRSQVMAAMWREANDMTSEGFTRVNALAHLAKMLGMTQRVEEKNVTPIGVMLIPIVNLEDWGVAAEVAQKQLHSRASNDS